MRALPDSASVTRAVAGIALLALAGAARAHTFCVTDSTQLQQALTDASDGGVHNGEDNLIAVAQGVYATGSGPFRFESSAAHSLMLEGGYSAACNAHVDETALTIL